MEKGVGINAFFIGILLGILHRLNKVITLLIIVFFFSLVVVVILLHMHTDCEFAKKKARIRVAC